MTESTSASPKQHPTTSTGTASLGGLFDGFEAYRTPTEADYHHVLTSGLVVPDTNVFLNLYRYNEQTRNDLLSLFSKLEKHLWIPRQVIAEFWRNREKVLQDARATDKTVRELTDQRDKTIATFRGWASRVKLPEDRNKYFVGVFMNAYENVIDGVSKLADNHAAEFARNTNKDPVVTQLESILSGHVGSALEPEEYQEAVAEAKRRAEFRRPPGYKDAGKDNEASAGDYLIWAQILREVQREPKDVLIVTGDVKEDWWRREQGELRGPRPELAEEIRSVGGVRLYMLQPDSLLRYGQRTLRLSISDKSVEDIERVDKYLAEASQTSTEDIRNSWEVVLESIKRYSKVAWMLLSHATVISFNSDTLVLEFSRQSDVKAFLASGHDQLLSMVIDEMFKEHPQIFLLKSPSDKREITANGSVSRIKPAEENDPWATENGYSDEPPF